MAVVQAQDQVQQVVVQELQVVEAAHQEGLQVQLTALQEILLVKWDQVAEAEQELQEAELQEAEHQAAGRELPVVVQVQELVQVQERAQEPLVAVQVPAVWVQAQAQELVAQAAEWVPEPEAEDK